MNYFQISSLLVFIANFFNAIIVFSKGENKKANRIWVLMCIAVIFWGFGAYKLASTDIKEDAVFWRQIANVGVILIPIFFYHFLYIFLGLHKKSQTLILHLVYEFGFIFLILNFFFPKELFRGELRFVFDQFYYTDWLVYKSSIYLFFYITYYWFLLSYIFFLLVAAFLNSKGIFRNQLKYLLVAAIVAWLGPTFMWLIEFRIDIYPYSNICIAIYPLIIAYAILKYRLMDINIAITRAGIFLVLYTGILGIPFFIAYRFQPYLLSILGEKWWLGPLGTSTVLATVGPFIYLYFDRKAEDRLLREQRQYQQTLRQASSGMIRVRELKRLLNLIVHVVTKTVKIEFASIFLADEENHHYAMAASRYTTKKPEVFRLDDDSELVNYFQSRREPIVYEEMQLRSQDNPNDTKAVAIEKELKELSAEVVIPSFSRDKLLGFIVLGKKISHKMYSQDDLNVFSVLANQAALAIENALFYEEIKETQEQLFQAEKMATIGTMADGLSHQINNRFQALSLIAGDSLDILKTTDVGDCSEELKSAVNQIKYALEKIQANVMQGGEVVQGLLKYSRPGQTGFEPVAFTDVISGALEMVQYKVHLYELDIEKKIPQDLPQLKCNLTQLEEVFFNLIDNANDAIKEKKALLRAEGKEDYKGRISISAEQQDSTVKIIFEDNGIGIKDRDKEKLFTPFFTTKVALKKGTGLGLYVIQKIIGYHGGTVSIDSNYKVGTKFEISLPLAGR